MTKTYNWRTDLPREKLVELCESHRREEAAAKADREQAERERDTALARVKELERQLQHAADDSEKNFEGWRQADIELKGTTESLQAAETALASARKLLKRATPWLSHDEPARDVYDNIHAWLTSHTAPVAAPYGAVALAAEMTKPKTDALAAELASLRAAPVAAPCDECGAPGAVDTHHAGRLCPRPCKP